MTDSWTPGPWTTGQRMIVGGDSSIVVSVAPNPANARLIAAAPEMAELLGDAFDALTTPGYDGPIDEIHALLARIRGDA